MTDTPRCLVVRLPNWVGDVVMATPALAALRARFPDARLIASVRGFQHGLLRGLPAIDTLWPTEERGWAGASRRAEELRKVGCDLAVLLPNSFRTALAPWRAKVPRRVGYAANGRSWLLTDRVHAPREGRRRRPEPMPDYYLRLLEPLGAVPEAAPVSLVVSDREAEQAEACWKRWGFAPTDVVVGLNPGASFGASKLWLPEGWAQVADRLVRAGARVVLLVGPGEESIAAEIEAHAQESWVSTADSIVPLDVLKAVIRRLRVLVTNDTGPRHIASAVGVPAVVLMGPTDPRYTAYGLDRVTVLREPVACAPCHLKRCPLDHRCMEALTSEIVLAAVERWLAQPATA